MGHGVSGPASMTPGGPCPSRVNPGREGLLRHTGSPRFPTPTPDYPRSVPQLPHPCSTHVSQEPPTAPCHPTPTLGPYNSLLASCRPWAGLGAWRTAEEPLWVSRTRKMKGVVRGRRAWGLGSSSRPQISWSKGLPSVSHSKAVAWKHAGQVQVLLARTCETGLPCSCRWPRSDPAQPSVSVESGG